MNIRNLFLLAAGLTGFGAQAQDMDGVFSATPKREARAVWMTTIGGLDWPKTYAHTPRTIEKQKQELRSLLDRLQAAGMNTVLMQTRVRGTVIYPSAIEPWDGCVSGNPGTSPGYDPLAFAVEECHKRGMEIHAWVVSIPIGRQNGLGCKWMKRSHPELVMKVGDEMFMRPDRAGTASYIASLCREIAQNYDVDGIHLDYIRYPEQMKLNISRTEARANISRIVRAVSEAVRGVKPWIKMSCSPIGKRNDLSRASSRGWNAEEKGCQDVERWTREGWMDQIYPMMYFRGNQFFPFAADWREHSNGRTVAAGLGIYFLSPKEANWDFMEIQREMGVCRQLGLGTAMFRNKFLMDNVKGIYDFTADNFYRYPALVPEMSWHKRPAPATPQRLTVSHSDTTDYLHWSPSAETTASSSGESKVYYNVYGSDQWPVDVSKASNIVAMRLDNTTASIPQSQFFRYYAVTAIDRYGKESSALQQDAAEADYMTEAAQRPQLIKSDGTTATLPHRPSTLDADYIIIESVTGIAVSTKPYTPSINVSDISDGMYILRSLSRKGKTHQVGWLFVRRHDI